MTLREHIEAVREALEYHQDTCGSVLVDGNPYGYPCSCGRDAALAALDAALAALDEIEREAERLREPGGARLVALGGEVVTASEAYRRMLEERKLSHAAESRLALADELAEAMSVLLARAKAAGMDITRSESACSEDEWNELGFAENETAVARAIDALANYEEAR